MNNANEYTRTQNKVHEKPMLSKAEKREQKDTIGLSQLIDVLHFSLM